ncbi:MAG: Zn-dependent exopeptidase M28 [Firmicutes bacterium]|nr:Zn-dependent exopeptidase M28 [Bacillota bacterium]
MFRYVEDLAEKIGPRGSTTRAERTAAQYLKAELQIGADTVEVQPFKSVPTFSWAFGLHYLLMALAAFGLGFWPMLAAVVALVNGAGYLLESYTYEFFTRILPKNKSQNVLAKKSLRSTDAEKLPRIIIVAHYDTSRSGLNFHPNLVAGFRKSFIVLNVSMAVITILAFFAGVAALAGLELPGWYPWLALPFGLYLLVVFGMLVHRELFGVHVAGGNDNASGVAVMLHSFNELAQTLPEGAEVWALATGCEEAGTVGMLRFLEEYGEEIRDDYIINLDNLGIGNVKYIDGEGLFSPMPADRDLVLAAAAFARSNPDLTVGPHVYQALTTDATPALVRGYKTMSIMAFTEDGILPHWHWPTDKAENVSLQNLATASKLVQSIARQLWGQEYR